MYRTLIPALMAGLLSLASVASAADPSAAQSRAEKRQIRLDRARGSHGRIRVPRPRPPVLERAPADRATGKMPLDLNRIRQKARKS